MMQLHAPRSKQRSAQRSRVTSPQSRVLRLVFASVQSRVLRLVFASAQSRVLRMGLLLLFCLGAPRVASAHPDLDRGKRLSADLEFEPALTAFEAAINSGTLTRDELLELLAERALLLHGLRRQDDLVQDFVWLSALDPDYRLDLRAPPELVAMWTSIRDQGRGRLAVTLSAETTASTLEARASLTGTVPDGAHARISVRAAGGTWRTKDGDHVQATASANQSFELYAEALGLGGVVLSQSHSPDAPLQIKLQAGESPLLAGGPPVDGEESFMRKHRPWVIGGAVALVAIVVLTTVVLVKNGQQDNSQQTSLKPMVSF